MNDSRELTSVEQARLRRLLSVEFPGVSELRKQAQSARAVETAESETIRFAVDEDLPVAQVISPKPVQGTCILDERWIELELFIKNGRIFLMGFIFVPHDAPGRVPEADEVTIYVQVDVYEAYRLALEGSLPSYVTRGLR